MTGDPGDRNVEPVQTINPKQQGLLGRLRAILDARQVVIVDEHEQTDDLKDLIKIYEDLEYGEDDAIASLIKIDEQGSSKDNTQRVETQIGTEPFVALAVSAEMNQQSAAVFVQTLRDVTLDILGNNAMYDSYAEPQWYDTSDLRHLAARWQLPLCLLVRGGIHFNLILAPPEHGPNGYSVLVYDPIRGGEEYVQLPNWDNTYSGDNLTVSGIFVNDIGYDDLRSGKLNLALFGDRDFARNPGIMAAKLARVQFDGYNCGPACIFALALRQAVQEDWNEFKFAGKEVLFGDTGLNVLTREEILS